jgi:hypothetical protein
LIFQTQERPAEVGDPGAHFGDHRLRGTLDELGLPSWASAFAISPFSRAISLARRACSAATSIGTCSARRTSPAMATGSARVAAAKSLSPSTVCTSLSFASAFSNGAAAPMNAASPWATSGMRSDGDRPISLRRLRQAPTTAFSRAIHASACRSIRSGCAIG